MDRLKPKPAPARSVGHGTGFPDDAVSDEALMVAFCHGDAKAFDALFDRYQRPIHAFLVRLVGSRSAEDLTQATFLSVVRARGRFRQDARFRPWLYAIAANAARDFLRRGKAERLTARGELSLDSAAESPAAAFDPGLHQAVHQALQQLPEGQRLAITLHRFQNLSFAEIAEALELTESAVKVRAHRGYEILRQLLRGIWEEKRLGGVRKHSSSWPRTLSRR